MADKIVDIKKTTKKKSQFGEIWHRFKKSKAAFAGLIIFCIILLVVILADVIVDYDVSITQNIPARLQHPSSEHIFGTDNFGRDIFARIIHGSRASLFIGVAAVAVAVVIGGILGAIAAYYGGLVDSIIMRVSDTIMCIPFMLLALTVVAALGTSMINVIIAMTISSVPRYIRIVRAAILPILGQDYVEAAHSVGSGDGHIIFRHILPNALGPIIVQTTMSIGSQIISAAGLSFLGMGIQPPTPEWGAMLNEAKQYMLTHPYMVIIPGIAIGLTALSMNLMGDGIRDAMDPKLKD